MAVWEVRISNVIKNESTISIDYQILKDSNVIKINSVTLEGDVIDEGAMKGRILKDLRRIKGIDEKSDSIMAFKSRTFKLNGTGTELVLNAIVSKE